MHGKVNGFSNAWFHIFANKRFSASASILLEAASTQPERASALAMPVMQKYEMLKLLSAYIKPARKSPGLLAGRVFFIIF